MSRHRAAFCVLAVALVAAISDSALAQTLGQAVNPEVPWWRVFGALLMCILLAVGGAFALRSRLGLGLGLGLRMPIIVGSDQRRLRLLETVRLSHQVDVCLLRWDDRDLIVAATPQGAVLLAERDAQASPPASASA